MSGTVSYSYLLSTVFALAIWVVLFLLLPRCRRAMLWTGLMLAAAGPISEFWSLRDYWHPPYLINIAIGPWRFGLEDFFLAFALAGICAGLFESLAMRKGWPELPRPSGPIMLRMLGWGVLGALILTFLTSRLRLNSIHALILAVVSTALLMSAGRREILLLSLPLSILYGLLYWLFYVFLFLPVFPGAIRAFWNIEMTWGIMPAGVPLEEILWAFSTLLFAGPALRICATERQTK